MQVQRACGGPFPAATHLRPRSVLLMPVLSAPQLHCRISCTTYRTMLTQASTIRSVRLRNDAVLLSAGGKTLAVLVGNNKSLWSSFQAAYEQEDALQQDADPLDCYTERCIRSAAGSLG